MVLTNRYVCQDLLVNIAVLVFTANFLAIGCSSNPSEKTPDATQHEQDYNWTVVSALEIERYYPDPVALPGTFNQYFLKRGETRTIWVGGDIPAGSADQYTDIWWKTGYHSEIQAADPIGGNKVGNVFFAQMNMRDRPPPDFPNIQPGDDPMEIPWTFHIGNSSHTSTESRTKTIKYVWNRRLNFEYHYHAGYDLTTLSPGVFDSITTAYAQGGTEISIFLSAEHAAEALIVTSGDLITPQQQLYNYAKGLGSPRYQSEGGYKKRVALLVAMKNIVEMDAARTEQRHTLDRYLAISSPVVNMAEQFEYPGFTCLFMDRIIGGNQSNQANAIKFWTIHELGHQRGLLGHNEATPPTENGHNGKWKLYCAMHTTSEPFFGNSEYLQALAATRFCEGHQQRLYNIYWPKEENP